MSNVPERRRGRSFPLPDLFDWLETGLPGVSPSSPWRVMPGLHGIRVEEELTDDAYVISAELPGISPDKDVEITVADDVLTIRAEREERTESKQRSEFRYGAFARSVRLPAGAHGDQATADYQDGILSVRVPVEEKKKGATTIPVKRG